MRRQRTEGAGQATLRAALRRSWPRNLQGRPLGHQIMIQDTGRARRRDAGASQGVCNDDQRPAARGVACPAPSVRWRRIDDAPASPSHRRVAEETGQAIQWGR